jgi:hypothetical protein
MAPGHRILSPLDSIQQNIPVYEDVTDSDTQIRNFFTDINTTAPALNTWPCSPTLHTTYIFLPDKERKVFATTPLVYLTRQVTPIVFSEIINNQTLRLDIHNPITRLIFIPRRTDTLYYRNNTMNFTNWCSWPQRPKIETQVPDNSSFIESANATGLLVPQGQKDIIQYLRILVDGNEIQELKPISFFKDLTPYRYLAGGANRDIPVYTFELHSPNAQPSGSINSSRIRNFDIDLQIYPLPSNTNYMYTVTVYVENLNFFLVESGMGDNKYAT